MTLSLAEKIAVITGGNSGIGFGIAQTFVAQGARVVLIGRNRDTLNEAVARLGAHSAAIPADAADPEAMRRVLETVASEHGRLDIFVANAGVGEHAPLGEITEEQFDTVVATNFKGVVFAVQAATKLMKPGASIVIIGSTGSVAPPAGMSIYGGTKAALVAAVHSWVQELKGSDIRINILSPGTVDTPSLRAAFAKTSGEKEVASIIASIEKRNPSQRIGSVAEIGLAAAFLASDAASYINGIELFADGGLRSV